jgi:hypothetical protein
MRLFASLVKKYRLSQEDIRSLENQIMHESAAWPVISGTGGVRKMRLRARLRERADAAICGFVTW